jgi:hypothetical protein
MPLIWLIRSEEENPDQYDNLSQSIRLALFLKFFWQDKK